MNAMTRPLKRSASDGATEPEPKKAKKDMTSLTTLYVASQEDCIQEIIDLRAANNLLVKQLKRYSKKLEMVEEEIKFFKEDFDRVRGAVFNAWDSMPSRGTLEELGRTVAMVNKKLQEAI